MFRDPGLAGVAKKRRGAQAARSVERWSPAGTGFLGQKNAENAKPITLERRSRDQRSDATIEMTLGISSRFEAPEAA